MLSPCTGEVVHTYWHLLQSPGRPSWTLQKVCKTWNVEFKSLPQTGSILLYLELVCLSIQPGYANSRKVWHCHGKKRSRPHPPPTLKTSCLGHEKLRQQTECPNTKNIPNLDVVGMLKVQGYKLHRLLNALGSLNFCTEELCLLTQTDRPDAEVRTSKKTLWNGLLLGAPLGQPK